MKFLLLPVALGALLRVPQHGQVSLSVVRRALVLRQPANATDNATDGAPFNGGNYPAAPWEGNSTYDVKVDAASSTGLTTSTPAPIPNVTFPWSAPNVTSPPNFTEPIPNATAMANATNATAPAANGTAGSNGTAGPASPPNPDDVAMKGSSVPSVPPPIVLDFCGDPIAHKCYTFVVTLLQCYAGCNAPGADPTAADFGGCVSSCQTLQTPVCGSWDLQGGMCSLENGSESDQCNGSCERFKNCVHGFGSECSTKRNVQEYVACFDTCVLEKTPAPR